MRSLAVPLAHAGAGATWQALLTLVSLGCVLLVVLVLLGRLRLRRGDDLVLPLAAVVILAALGGPTNSSTLSDWVGWAFPVGIVAVVALVLAATTALTLRPTSLLTLVAVLVAIVLAVTLEQPIRQAWHPITNASTYSATLTITAPAEGAAVASDELAVAVAVDGDWRITAPGGDGSQMGFVRIFVDGIELAPVTPEEDCAAGCVTATYAVTAEPGERTIVAELVAPDGTQLVSVTYDTIHITVT